MPLSVSYNVPTIVTMTMVLQGNPLATIESVMNKINVSVKEILLAKIAYKKNALEVAVLDIVTTKLAYVNVQRDTPELIVAKEPWDNWKVCITHIYYYLVILFLITLESLINEGYGITCFLQFSSSR